MTSSLREPISDPERIRALAHPLRLELLDILRAAGEATATDCAAKTGESVANCSFHLRTLAKYGYIDRAETRGREKPWRVIRTKIHTQPSPEVPGSLHAATELARLSFARHSQQLHESLDRLPEEPTEWIDATTFSTSAIWATAAEVSELATQITDLLERFDGRNDNPAQRPADVRRVHLMTTTYSDPAAQQP